MSDILTTIISTLGTIIVAAIGIDIKRRDARQAKLDEATAERAKRRKEESMLSLQLTSANTELTLATANAVLGKKNNGNVEEAYTAVSKAQEAYKEFERKILSEEITEI